MLKHQLHGINLSPDYFHPLIILVKLVIQSGATGLVGSLNLTLCVQDVPVCFSAGLL